VMVKIKANSRAALEWKALQREFYMHV